jgi:hypothetical protein
VIHPTTLHAPADATAAELAKARIFAMASADQTYDGLGENLKRALGLERRPLDRSPRRVRQELDIAARKARVLLRQIEAAIDNLPAEG